MELMGHLLIFFLAAGSVGLDRQLFPVAAIILLAAGVYFLGWGAILSCGIGLYFGLKGLNDQNKPK